jgi:prophage regulatory protein
MRLLPYSALRDRGIPYSRVHLARLVKAEQFPAPIQLGEGRIAWIEAEVDDWITARAAQRPVRPSVFEMARAAA